MTKSVKTQQWSKGTKLSKWTRIDKMAKACRTTSKNGPPWHQVIHRVTIDMDTKKILLDELVKNSVKCQEHEPLPEGARNIKT
eukprot:2194824-Amphidinium_carterae.3